MLNRLSIACIAVLFIAGIAHAQVVLDFEDGSLNDWEIIDDVDLGLPIRHDRIVLQSAEEDEHVAGL